MYATNSPKRTLESLHQLGICCAYDSILVALRYVRSLELGCGVGSCLISCRKTAAAASQILRTRALNERFLISYDNINFYKNVTAQRMHNRAHQTNYTAGYVLYMGTDKALPADSVDYSSALNTTLCDIRIGDGMRQYMTKAVEHCIGIAIMRYCRNAMQRQLRQGGSELCYKIADAPLKEIRASKARADYLTFPTLDIDEASIDGTIDLLQRLVDILGLDEQMVRDNVIWLSGDYLTVRNVARAIRRRVEHIQRIHNFGFIEPIAGLFHLQMNVLKMLMDTFEGACGEPGSLSTFLAILRRKGISKEIKDFHACDEFFNQVLDAHILARLMLETGTTTLSALLQWISTHRWPSVVKLLSSDYGDPMFVERRRSLVEDSIDAQVQQEISRLVAAREELKESRRGLWRGYGSGLSAVPLPRFDKRREELRIRKNLSASNWDSVWQNLTLFSIAGLIYRDFSETCAAGYSGRVAECIESFSIMFHVNTFILAYLGFCPAYFKSDH